MTNLNIYGYLTGWAIAIATVSLTFYTGILYERHYNTIIEIIEDNDKK